MRRGNRRRRRRRRSPWSVGETIGAGARRAGRWAATWALRAGPSVATLAHDVRRRVTERLDGAQRRPANRTRGGTANRTRRGRRGTALKRDADLRRRVGEALASIHGRGFVLWAAALVTGLVCVWQHVHSNELAREIEALRDAREAIETQIGLLEMECAELSSRKRIEEYAEERLGMRYPEAGEVIWLGPSDSGRPARDGHDYVMGAATRDTEG